MMDSDDIYGPSTLAQGNSLYLATGTPSRVRSRSNETAVGSPEDFRPRSDSAESRGSVSSIGSGHSRYQQQPLYVSTVQRDLPGHTGTPATARPPDQEIPAQPRVRTHTGMTYSPSVPPGSAQPTSAYPPHSHQVQISLDHRSMGAGGFVDHGPMPGSSYIVQSHQQTPPRTTYVAAAPPIYQLGTSTPNHGHPNPVSIQTTPPGTSLYHPSSVYDPRVPHHAWQEPGDQTRSTPQYQGLAERPAGFDKSLPRSSGRANNNNTGYSPSSPHSWQGLPPGVPQQLHGGSPGTPPQLTSHAGYVQSTTPSTQSSHGIPGPPRMYRYQAIPHMAGTQAQQPTGNFVATANIDMSPSSERQLQYPDLYKATRSTNQQPLPVAPAQPQYVSSSQILNNYPQNPGPRSMPTVSAQMGQSGHQIRANHHQQHLQNQRDWQQHPRHSHIQRPGGHQTNLMDTPIAVMPQGTAPMQPQPLPEQQPVLHVDWNLPDSEIAGEPSPRTSRSGSLNSDDQHYTQSLVLHQRARMDKLVKDLEEGQRMLNDLKLDVEQLETKATHRRFARSNSFPKIEDVQRLREDACKLQVDIQLLTRQMDLQDHAKPVTNPQDPSFYNSLQPGQRGSVHTPSLEMPGLPPPQHLPNQRLPPSRPPPPIPRPPPGPLNEEDNVELWNCSACTFLNHPLVDKCEMCEMPRVTAPSRPR